MHPDQLFDTLLRRRRLISYGAAYRALIGEYGQWRNLLHAAEVATLAATSSTRAIGSTNFRLDALVVSADSREPSTGHFTKHGYSLEEWRSSFGLWQLIK